MNIGLLTYYNVHNHGSVLQAYGLQEVLKRLGHNVRFLSFERSYEYIHVEQIKKYRLGVSSIPFYFKYMLEKGIGNVLYNYKKRNILNVFRKVALNLDVPYDAFEGDAVVIGSDEVFSLEIGYNPMMYGYGLKAKQVLGYACSFGPTTIQEIENKSKKVAIQQGLAKFRAISVRDYNSQSIVKIICEKSVPLACDPVILYGYENEMKTYKPAESAYIVIYAYDNRMNDPDEVSAIKTYAKIKNLKVYSIGFYHKWCDKNINVSPMELLNWINNATLVITDTFHGAVISMICNTPMVVKFRNNKNKLAFLLNEYRLSDRSINVFTDLDTIANKMIDFERVNKKIAEAREASMSYLKSSIVGR